MGGERIGKEMEGKEREERIGGGSERKEGEGLAYSRHLGRCKT